MSSKWRGAFISSITGDLLSSITLRLVRPTCKNRPGYSIVACYGPGRRTPYDENRTRSTIDEVGYFDDCVNSQGKRICLLDIGKIRKYLAEGAEPTIPVWKLLGASGAFPVHPKVYAIAAENQYMQQVQPQEDSFLGLSEFPDKYPQYVDDSDPNDPEYEEFDPYEYDTPDDNHRQRLLKDSGSIKKEDRDNREKGDIRTGDFKHLRRHLDSIEEASPIQKRALEHIFVKGFWDLNKFDKDGRGLHDNFNASGPKNKQFDFNKKQYGYWVRGVRKLGYTDPFKLRHRPDIHRPGENEELLEETKPQAQ